MVQSCHAAIEATKSFIPRESEHPSVIVLGLTPHQLEKVQNYLNSAGIAYRSFTEPDIGDQLTAIATELVSGSQRRVFKKFQLLKCKEAA